MLDNTIALAGFNVPGWPAHGERRGDAAHRRRRKNFLHAPRELLRPEERRHEGPLYTFETLLQLDGRTTRRRACFRSERPKCWTVRRERDVERRVTGLKMVRGRPGSPSRSRCCPSQTRRERAARARSLRLSSRPMPTRWPDGLEDRVTAPPHAGRKATCFAMPFARRPRRLPDRRRAAMRDVLPGRLAHAAARRGRLRHPRRRTRPRVRRGFTSGTSTCSAACRRPRHPLPSSASTIETTRAIVAPAPRHATPAADPAPPAPTPVVESPATVSSRPPLSVDSRGPMRTPRRRPPRRALVAPLSQGGARRGRVTSRMSTESPRHSGSTIWAPLRWPRSPASSTPWPPPSSRSPRDLGITGDYAAFGLADFCGALPARRGGRSTSARPSVIPATRSPRTSRPWRQRLPSSRRVSPAARRCCRASRTASSGWASTRYRLAFSRMRGGGYLDIPSSGYTAQLFPKESVGGGGAPGRVVLPREELGGRERRLRACSTASIPVPGDPSVAGGALDEQTRILRWLSPPGEDGMTLATLPLRAPWKVFVGLPSPGARVGGRAGTLEIPPRSRPRATRGAVVVHVDASGKTLRRCPDHVRHELRNGGLSRILQQGRGARPLVPGLSRLRRRPGRGGRGPAHRPASTPSKSCRLQARADGDAPTPPACRPAAPSARPRPMRARLGHDGGRLRRFVPRWRSTSGVDAGTPVDAGERHRSVSHRSRPSAWPPGRRARVDRRAGPT